jgi:adenylosuccinate synthase
MIDAADVVVGLAWGDEAKGKITSHLAKIGDYDLVVRWAGGNNAGHTVYVDGKKYKTHLVPSGVFYGITSLVGPGCVLHPESFQAELDYLESHGFDTSLVKVHPNCHIVTDEHIEIDKRKYAVKLGTTSKGIAPVYSDKAARVGVLAKEVLDKKLLWDSELRGTILCEGAQGVWLDIDHGNYPFVTSSITLPYGACSVGFPPQKIRDVYGAAKAYDTRSGEDPLFPASLLEDPDLKSLADVGQEYGVTTGRRRKTRWLDLDRLIESINLTGTTHVVISKIDVLKEVGIFQLYHNKDLIKFESFDDWSDYVCTETDKCSLVQEVIYSSSPEKI